MSSALSASSAPIITSRRRSVAAVLGGGAAALRVTGFSLSAAFLLRLKAAAGFFRGVDVLVGEGVLRRLDLVVVIEHSINDYSIHYESEMRVFQVFFVNTWH